MKILPEPAREGSLALLGKHYFDRLFELERKFDELTPEKRYEKRQESSKPLMEEFFAWANSCGAIPKSPVEKAAYYALSQRKYLKRYLLDGRLEISNNRAENSIRPFVMGRKNWLFSNTPNGAKASAVYYSLIVSARENGLVPFEYLARVFAQAPNGASIHDLLPWSM